MKKHGIRLKWLLVIGVAVLGVAFLYEKDHVQVKDPYVNALAENIGLFDDGSSVTLESIVPFEWDEVYVVSGSVSHARLEALVPELEETVSGESQFIFLLNGEPVDVIPLEERPDARYRFDFGDFGPAGTAALHLMAGTEVAFEKNTLSYGSETCDLLILKTDLSENRIVLE